MLLLSPRDLLYRSLARHVHGAAPLGPVDVRVGLDAGDAGAVAPAGVAWRIDIARVKYQKYLSTFLVKVPPLGTGLSVQTVQTKIMAGVLHESMGCFWLSNNPLHKGDGC